MTDSTPNPADPRSFIGHMVARADAGYRGRVTGLVSDHYPQDSEPTWLVIYCTDGLERVSPASRVHVLSKREG